MQVCRANSTGYKLPSLPVFFRWTDRVRGHGEILMKKLLLGVVFASLLLTPALRADEPKKETPTEPRVVVWDGDQIGDSAKGWASAASGKAEITLQDKVVRTAGKKTVAFRGQGKEYIGGGWNWFGWFPEDDGTDIAGFKDLQFWAKLDGAVKPTILNVSLISSDKAKKAGDACSLAKYCPELADGKWHQITIPIADLDAKGSLNRGKVWETMIGTWSPEPASFTLYLDEIAFVGKAEHKSSPSAERARRPCRRACRRAIRTSATWAGGTSRIGRRRAHRGPTASSRRSSRGPRSTPGSTAAASTR